jgi:hypothetical protein
MGSEPDGLRSRLPGLPRQASPQSTPARPSSTGAVLPTTQQRRPYRSSAASWSLLRSLLFRGAVKRLDTPRNGQGIGICRSRSSSKLLGGHPRSGQFPDKRCRKRLCLLRGDGHMRCHRRTGPEHRPRDDRDRGAWLDRMAIALEARPGVQLSELRSGVHDSPDRCFAAVIDARRPAAGSRRCQLGSACTRTRHHVRALGADRVRRPNPDRHRSAIPARRLGSG